jgi:hypothetical protein
MTARPRQDRRHQFVKEYTSMPLSILVAIAIISLIGLAVAVVSTVRAESRQGTSPSVSLTYRAYGA